MAFTVILSHEAEKNYNQICSYILHKFSVKEVVKFDERFTETLLLLSVSPYVFPIASKNFKVHRCLIYKLTVVYYVIVGNQVQILSLFDGRQGSKRNKFE